MVEYLEQVLALDATGFGREMFEQTSDLTRVAAEDIVTRDAKDYDAGGGQTLRIVQVETVGQTLEERREELLRALDAVREREGHARRRADGHRHHGQGARGSTRPATAAWWRARSATARATGSSTCRA